MIELELVGVRVEMPSSQPLVLLKEISGERHLPIWIGAPEASAIAVAQQGMEAPRPLTHDLMKNMIQALGHSLDHVTITNVEDAVFYAQVVFEDGTTVSSRASDAIALSLRTQARIWCTESVIEDAGVIISTESDDESVEVDDEQQMQQFREFLEDVDPEDFGS